MKILKSAIVSNSDMIKNYKTQREQAEIVGKIFIFKNNQPNAVLFSISEYERVAEIVEKLENMSESDHLLMLDYIRKFSTISKSTLESV